MISVRHPTLCEDTAALLPDPLKNLSNKYFSLQMFLFTSIVVTGHLHNC